MKGLYLVGGILTTGLGFIGIVLPLLPTVPFLLLAAYCFHKGSPCFHCWLTNTGVYTRYVMPAVEAGGMTRQSKITILCLSTMMMACVFVFAPHVSVRCAIIAALIVKVYIFTKRIKTLEEST